MVCQCPRYQQNWKQKSLGWCVCQQQKQYFASVGGNMDSQMSHCEQQTFQLWLQKREKGSPQIIVFQKEIYRFDKEAVFSRCRSRKFKAKNIRNNMVLYKSNSKIVKVNRISRKICLILSDRENSWNEKQQVKLKERLELKLKKAQKAKDYTKKLLQDCKSWGGPCTSVDELHQMLNGKDNHSHILKTEMAYYAHTHKADKIARKQLFRINGITYEGMLENLSILLDDENDVSTSTIANLPMNRRCHAIIDGDWNRQDKWRK